MFIKMAHRPIQYIGCDICACVVPLPSIRNSVDWRLMVKELIAIMSNIGLGLKVLKKKMVLNLFWVGIKIMVLQYQKVLS